MVPALVRFLVYFNLITLQRLRQARPFVVVGSFLGAAIVTPPDVVTQCVLAVPIWLLFEGALIWCWLFQRRQQ